LIAGAFAKRFLKTIRYVGLYGKVMKYKIGQAVKVKNGVLYPDDS
jgi:hypothetical protein